MAAFEQLLVLNPAMPASGAAAGAGDRLRALGEAVGLYTGDLLEGCFDEWLLGERERSRQRWLDALAELSGLFEARGEVGEAITHAERLLRGIRCGRRPTGG